MIISYKEILLIGIIMVSYLWLIYGIRKFRAIDLMRNITPRDKKVSLLLFGVLVFAISISSIGKADVFLHKGTIDDALNSLLVGVYCKEYALIYMIKFIGVDLIALLLIFISIQKVMERFKVQSLPLYYLVILVIISKTTYDIADLRWSESILFLVYALIVICISDCLLHGLGKKKFIYIASIVIAVSVINYNTSSYGLLPLLAIILMIVEGVVLSILYKYLYYLRNIWRRLLIIIIFIAIWYVNWMII